MIPLRHPLKMCVLLLTNAIITHLMCATGYASENQLVEFTSILVKSCLLVSREKKKEQQHSSCEKILEGSINAKQKSNNTLAVAVVLL